MSTKNTIEWVRYSFPTPANPCYHLAAAVRIEPDADQKVRAVRVNGKQVRDFWVYNNGVWHKLNVMHRGKLAKVVIRCDWTPDSSHAVEIDVEPDGKSKLTTLKADSTAPSFGGYWDANWKYYMGVVLRENSGLARENEPVHVTLATYADRITHPEREVRVVAVDPLSGVHTEVVSQTYDASTWTTETPDEYCQNTTTCEVAFLADVPAGMEKVYLVFYGNPDAPDPQYQTDLTVEGEGLELNIANSFYRMHTQPTGGAIDEIFMKMGVNTLFEHRLETNGAVQWNPGVYAPKRAWIHSSDWNPPPHSRNLTGPVFCMTKRWGVFPEYPEIEVSITYLLYAYNPHLMFSSTMDVVDDLHCVALRNGEFVFNHAVFDEFAWKNPSGDVGSMVIKSGPRHPRHSQRMEPDTPWVAYYSREHNCGFGGMTLNLSEMRRSDGLPRKDYPYIYLTWGPWTYFSRVYTYSFGSNNPQRMVKVGKDSTYHEQMAFMPFQLGETDGDRFEQLEERYSRLSDPLDIRTSMDTDDRVPEEWVPPILVAEFEEMEDAEDV